MMIFRTSRSHLKTYRLALAAAFIVTSGLTMTETICAEERFVKPAAEVVVRRGQGSEYKIVAMVKDGDSVELLEEADDYALVRLGNGREGWMLKRFLSVDPPLERVVETLQTEKDELLGQAVERETELEELSDQLRTIQAELKESQAERDRIARELDDLRRDTADVVSIKRNLDQTREENAVLVQNLAFAEKENGNLKQDRAVNWFLAGAGVLFAGVVIGRLPKPTRRRKQSLLS